MTRVVLSLQLPFASFTAALATSATPTAESPAPAHYSTIFFLPSVKLNFLPNVKTCILTTQLSWIGLDTVLKSNSKVIDPEDHS